MKKSAYGKPVLIGKGETVHINRIENIDELSIQELVFDYPECLPISDIDESYNPVIPVCKELRTSAGYLDIFMITPNGDIVIVETKLWRNPEARRKVIAQILDYAKELSNWSYEDLQRELNRALKRKGNTLYEFAKEADNNLLLNESDFVDAVNRNLFRGKFLLLIVGDGIREGATKITDFLANAGHLNFTFGMVELSIYEIDKDKRIVLPRTIVKTTEIQKISIELPEGLIISNSINDQSQKTKEIEGVSPEVQKRRAFFRIFWEEFIKELELDDPGQVFPNPSISQNLFIYPGKNKYAWISAYFSQSSKRVGVYFRCQNDQNGLRVAEQLTEFKDDIMKELGEEVIWSWDHGLKDGFGVRLPIDDVYSKKNRTKIKEFFANWINQFVNVLRPRMNDFI